MRPGINHYYKTDPKDITSRSSHPDVFLVIGFLKIWSKFTEEHPCKSVISIKVLCNFIEITLWHGCSPITLLYVFRTPFPKNTSGRLLLEILIKLKNSNLNLQYSLKFNSSTVVLSLILRVLHLIRTNMPLSCFKRTFLERMISFTWNEC